MRDFSGHTPTLELECAHRTHYPGLGLLDQIREGVGMARGSISWQHSGQTPMARSSAC
jgi:hypothetical protein